MTSLKSWARRRQAGFLNCNNARHGRAVPQVISRTLPQQEQCPLTFRAHAEPASGGIIQKSWLHKSEDPRLQGFPSKLDHDIIQMAIPSLAMIILDPLMGMVDTAIVGHLGKQVLAGVGLGTVLAGSLNWMFAFITILITSKVATFRSDKAKVVLHVSQSIWVALIAGICTMAFLLTAAPYLLPMMPGDPVMIGHTQSYIIARCIANPFVLLNYVFIGCCRGLKDAKTPLMAAVIANISNLVMDIVFVMGLHMGGAGAALATSFSQILSCGILFSFMYKRGYVDLPTFRQGPKWSILKPFLRDGAAMSIRLMSAVGMILAASSLLAQVNTASQAAHEIIRQLWIVSYQFAESMNISNQSLVAAAIGQDDQQYALDVMKQHALYAVSIMSCIALATTIFRGPLAAIFISDATVLAIVVQVLPFIALFLPLEAVSSIVDGTLTATGQAAWVATRSTMFMLLAIGLLLTAASVFQMSVLRVWVILKVYTLARFPIFVHRLLFSEYSPFHKVTQPAPAVSIQEQPSDSDGEQIKELQPQTAKL